MDSKLHQLVLTLTVGFYIFLHNLESQLDSSSIWIISESGFVIALSFDMFVVRLFCFCFSHVS